MPRIHPHLCTCRRCELDLPTGGSALDRILAACAGLTFAALVTRGLLSLV